MLDELQDVIAPRNRYRGGAVSRHLFSGAASSVETSHEPVAAAAGVATAVAGVAAAATSSRSSATHSSRQRTVTEVLKLNKGSPASR